MRLSAATGQTKVGDLVYQGDVIQTGIDGALGLVFADNTSFNVSSNARMELTEFIYDPKGKSNSTLLNLQKGAFTFIAGQVARTGNMKVETPAGTMGIRGTAPRVEIMPDGSVKFTTLIEENKKELQNKNAVPAAGGRRSQDAPLRTAKNSAIKDIALCNGADGTEAKISGCTDLIESHVNYPKSLALVYNNRANARASNGDFEQAIKDYDQSIKLDPTDAKALNNRGIAYEKQGEHERAIADFNAAVEVSRDYASAFANRAQVYEKKRDYQRALNDFDEAIRLQPTLASLWNERCWLRTITGAPQNALSDCNEAIRLGPASAAKFNSRGFAYLKLGRWESAIADFNSALQLNSKQASSLYGRGFAKLKIGDNAGGNTDIAAATSAKQNIVEDLAGYGLP